MLFNSNKTEVDENKLKQTFKQKLTVNSWRNKIPKN